MKLKQSKQRDCIRQFLKGQKDHPTADAVYANVRKSFPSISLGTVYRNLALLTDVGEIARIRVGDGADHFDGNVTPHHHFVCKACGCVCDFEPADMQLPPSSSIHTGGFKGQVEGYTLHFYGKCEKCCNAS